MPVADLKEGPGGPGPPLILGKKNEMTEGKKASRASKPRPLPSPPPLAQSLDPPVYAYLIPQQPRWVLGQKSVAIMEIDS